MSTGLPYPNIQHLIPGLRRYVDDHIRTGDFLYACLSDNLADAVCRADDENSKHLREIVDYINYEVPSKAHGSREKVEAWLAPPDPRAYDAQD